MKVEQWALLISAVALVASGLSVWYIRLQAKGVGVQAKVAQAQLEMIRDQWHDLRAPRIHAYYHITESGGHEAITFTNRGPVDLGHITIETGVVGHRLIKGLAGSSKVDHVGPWPVGHGESYVINRERADAGHVTFRVTCVSRDGTETWTVPVACEIPQQPPTPRLRTAVPSS